MTDKKPIRWDVMPGCEQYMGLAMSLLPQEEMLRKAFSQPSRSVMKILPGALTILYVMNDVIDFIKITTPPQVIEKKEIEYIVQFIVHDMRSITQLENIILEVIAGVSHAYADDGFGVLFDGTYLYQSYILDSNTIVLYGATSGWGDIVNGVLAAAIITELSFAIDPSSPYVDIYDVIYSRNGVEKWRTSLNKATETIEIGGTGISIVGSHNVGGISTGVRTFTIYDDVVTEV